MLFGITPAKAICGLYLANEDNVDLNADRGKALGREIFWLIFKAVPIVNLIWIATARSDSRKQGWHDKIAGTLVVRRP